MQTLQLFFSLFGIIFIAEFPDKTAIASFMLATHQRALPVFVGAALAFFIHALIAVLLGAMLGFLPAHYVKLGAALLFIFAAILMWRRKTSEAEAQPLQNGKMAFAKTAWLSFGIIFLAEWGDLTQLAIAALAARERRPWLVLSSSTLALWSVCLLAILGGRTTQRWVSPQLLTKAASIIFVLIGIYLLMTEFLRPS